MNALLVILGLALFATVITYEAFRFFASRFLVVFSIALAFSETREQSVTHGDFYRASLAGEISGGAGENERITQAFQPDARLSAANSRKALKLREV
jgi:hypothetical protein